MFRTAGPRRATTLAASALATAAVVATLLPTGAAVADDRAPAAVPPVPARYAAQELRWQPCEGDPSLQCADMTVPLDWHHPDSGRDITVVVSRKAAADPSRRRGVLMTAAGGPGASGLLRIAGLVKDEPEVGAVYDVVSFDQRGVGKSTPVDCQTAQESQAYWAGDFRDRSPAAVGRVVDNARALAGNCRDRQGELVRHLTTDQAARDMDLYRALLGEQKITYYGASYATMLGAYYATEFPERLERAVLDSNIAFADDWQTWEEGQPRSFQRRFEEDFLPWLAQHDDVYHYGRTPAEAKATWERRRAALREHPLDLGGGKVLDPNHFDFGASNAIYSAKEGFPGLAQALAAVEHWDSATAAEKGLVAKVYGGYLSSAFLSDFLSVTCNDTPWNRDADHWKRQSGRLAARYPLVGARVLAFGAACAAWPQSSAPQIKVTGKGLPPVLMLNSLHDPATYYEGAVRAHRALRGSRLVTVTGGDHGVYRRGSACVERVVNDYLLEGKVPERDLTCAGAPLPGATAISGDGH
ncbi:alpha/beta hydrolase [Streptomyces gamaensis]|uniref:Alpha/beta hydrolase n=1 Tax=Streptomyces gamaensis TaxID=1763542 RepID=A0ABW0Z3T6_9ACTN